ncbi:hypothetical protein V6N11_049934 [Hibiscus sabdariffa]|uniref:Uncharacterized protein n=1 Tax=Hibiscus sabdariffa TaxID=183260 RepID=A0ABR2T8C7_9ROSI
MMKNQIRELDVPDHAFQYSSRHTCGMAVHKLVVVCEIHASPTLLAKHSLLGVLKMLTFCSPDATGDMSDTLLAKHAWCVENAEILVAGCSR